MSEVSPWFSKAFGAFYTEVYSHRSPEEAQKHLPIIQKLAQLNNSDLKLLDLGCGQGRYTELLHQERFQVVGLDYSQELLQIAQREFPHLPLLRGNMLSLPFENQFDRVLSLFTSFGYFSDDRDNHKVLTEMSRALKPNGLLYLDFLNAHLVKESPWEEKNLEDYLQRSKKEILVPENAVKKTIELSKNSTPLHQYYEYVKLYDLSWFEQQCQTLPLTVKSVYGNYDGEAFHPSESPRLILLFQKQG